MNNRGKPVGELKREMAQFEDSTLKKLAYLKLAKAHVDALVELHAEYPDVVPDISDREVMDLGMAVYELDFFVNGPLPECAAHEPNAETKSSAPETQAKPTDLDSVAERILGAFKSKDDTRTDVDLLAASGLDREAYLDTRDFLLLETEEISELADGVPTEYIRNWPRKAEAAA